VVQEDLVADLEVVSPTAVVRVFRILMLSMLEVGAKVLKVPVDKLCVIGSGWRRGTGVDESGELRVVALVCEERSHVGCRVERVIVSELAERKQIGPVGLLVVAENAEVLLNDLVCDFR